MATWQYHIEPMPVRTISETVELLNHLGSIGWELVTCFPSGSHLLFKRKEIK